MKNREPNRQLTIAELYAVERAAKAARTAEMARLVRVAIAGVKGVFHA